MADEPKQGRAKAWAESRRKEAGGTLSRIRAKHAEMSSASRSQQDVGSAERRAAMDTRDAQARTSDSKAHREAAKLHRRAADSHLDAAHALSTRAYGAIAAAHSARARETDSPEHHMAAAVAHSQAAEHKQRAIDDFEGAAKYHEGKAASAEDVLRKSREENGMTVEQQQAAHAEAKAKGMPTIADELEAHKAQVQKYRDLIVPTAQDKALHEQHAAAHGLLATHGGQTEAARGQADAAYSLVHDTPMHGEKRAAEGRQVLRAVEGHLQMAAAHREQSKLHEEHAKSSVLKTMQAGDLSKERQEEVKRGDHSAGWAEDQHPRDEAGKFTPA